MESIGNLNMHSETKNLMIFGIPTFVSEESVIFSIKKSCEGIELRNKKWRTVRDSIASFLEVETDVHKVIDEICRERNLYKMHLKFGYRDSPS